MNRPFRRLLACMLPLWLVLPVFAQVPAPGSPPARPFLVHNAVIHDGQGKVLEKGFIQVEEGRITAIGGPQPASFLQQASSRFDLIDAEGQHLYPGFILLNTPLGLNEIDAVRATLDHTETGDENPGSHTLAAYNTDSDVIPTLRLNGILMAQIAPRGNRIRGMSSVVQLDAWNWEDAAVLERDALHLEWPSKYAVQGWWAEPGPTDPVQAGQVQEQVRSLERLFEETRMYMGAVQKRKNSRLEALIPVLQGTRSLFLHARFAADIVAGLEFCRMQGIGKVVLVSGSQALEVAGLLQARRIPVVFSRVHSLPLRPEDPVQWPVEAAVRLHRAGVQVALDYQGDMEAMGARNLAFLAGSTTRYGLSNEEALQLITRNPARILGLENRCGVLDKGRDATFFLSRGDALDMRTQDLTRVWIQGRPVSTESKQTLLYRKFKDKPEPGRPR